MDGGVDLEQLTEAFSPGSGRVFGLFLLRLVPFGGFEACGGEDSVKRLIRYGDALFLV